MSEEQTYQSMRLQSIDTFRGLTIFLMVLVIAVAGYRPLPQTRTWFGSLPVSTWHHAEVGWEQFEAAKLAEGLTPEQIKALPEYRLKNVGLTITDLVAPFFVFIVGLCIPLSRSQHGAAWRRRVYLRTIKLILAGILYISLILGISWWWGILQAIGVAYLMGSLLLYIPTRWRWLVTSGVLLFHLLMSAWVPWWLHFGETDLPFFTIANLKGSMLKPLRLHCLPWVSISYGAMTMFGVLLGEAVATKEVRLIYRRGLILGVTATLLGYLIHKIGLLTGLTGLCFNKPDVTVAYALFTSGLASLLFVLIYYLVDVRGWRRWTWFFQVMGMNALLAYFMQVIMRLGFRALRLEPFFSAVPNDQVQQWAQLFNAPHWQNFWLNKSGYHGLLWGLIWTLCLWTIIYFCNKKNIYWKL
jgi:predicted acyltransferase